MNQYHKHQSEKPPKGKAFYLAAAACLTAIGVSAWMTFDSVGSLMKPAESSSMPETPVHSETNAVNRPLYGVPDQRESRSETKPQSEPRESSRPETAVSSEENTASETVSSEIPPETASQGSQPVNRPVYPTVSEPPAVSEAPVNESFLMPVPGKVTKPFGESLYSLTLGDWRSHSGVDLAANGGSNVLSVGAGKILTIEQDDTLGWVISAAYDDLEVRYCGMGSNPSVREGDAVEAGQVLGALAEVPGESAEESHLHLEVLRDGAPVEPLSALGKEDLLPSEED